MVSDFRNMEAAKMASRDPVLELVAELEARGELEMSVPDDRCLDMEKSPGKLSEWIYRNEDTCVENRAFEALKWTRIVAQKYEAKFEVQDGVHGPMARAVHESSVALLGFEKEFQAAKAHHEKTVEVIMQVAAKKKEQESKSGYNKESLATRHERIDTWARNKIEEKDFSKLPVCLSMQKHITSFSENLVLMILSAEAEHATTTSAAPTDECYEADLSKELEAQLKICMSSEKEKPVSPAHSPAATLMQ